VVAIPRVIVELESLKDCAYDPKYHNKLQGFVYNLLRTTPRLTATFGATVFN
jgi:CRISPR/Cas system endoribonuclease Cas6 (RAMP superfamily)